MKVKSYLFFFVHPSKFHVFRHTINYLKNKGHKVDIVITQKDVLDQLVKNEGWAYTNIFPKGRKIRNIPTLLSAGINFIITILRLYRYVGKKKYDLFITDDLLVYIGKIKKVPSIVFVDDDLSVVKQFSLILKMATHCLAPSITDLEEFNKKKIGFNGYKELAYLHPNHFFPDPSVVKAINPGQEKYFFIRLVLLKSYHDMGKQGLNDENLRSLISVLETHGKVFISSERMLPEDLKKYQLTIEPSKIAHVLYFSELYIGDSQTMSSEAAILGVPTFRINDFAGKISVMNEKEEKYKLSKNYLSDEFSVMMDDIIEVLSSGKYKNESREKILKMLTEKIDLSAFMKWFFENYPHSLQFDDYMKTQNSFVKSYLWKEKK